MQEFDVPAANWPIGPPAPKFVTYIVRVLQVVALIIVIVWISLMGGLRFSPKPTEDGNDTGQLFNWHPLLIVLAFPICMAEAVLAYRAPIIYMSSRKQKKAWHFILHTVAIALVILAVTAVFQSHRLKQPVPMNDLYSPHSWAGLAVLSLIAIQYTVGAVAYLWPKWTLANRKALGPVHIFLGSAVFILGMAVILTGVQEKTTFLQLANHKGVHTAVIRLPAALQIVLILLTLSVLYHLMPGVTAYAAAVPVETISLTRSYSASDNHHL